jgi:hypothetical protein
LFEERAWIGSFFFDLFSRTIHQFLLLPQFTNI